MRFYKIILAFILIFFNLACSGSSSNKDNTPPTTQIIPTIVIDNVTINEGNSGVSYLEITVSDSSSAEISFSYETESGTATSGEDFVAKTGTAIIATGDTGTTIRIEIIGDTKVERDETFDIILTFQDATFSKTRATGTILNDDNAELTIGDKSTKEGIAGGKYLTFIVESSAISDFEISFDYETFGRIAIAGEDFIQKEGIATISPGSRSASIDIIIEGDNKEENDEVFDIIFSNPKNATFSKTRATGTILNDDNAELVIFDATTNEGYSNTTDLEFILRSTTKPPFPILVDYSTTNGTAIAGLDYVAQSGTAIIPAGNEATSIVVTIKNDKVIEKLEQFFVDFTNLRGATTDKTRAVGAIINNNLIELSVMDTSIDEGNSGRKNLIFNLTTDATVNRGEEIEFYTVNGTATAGEDYIAKSGIVTIPQGRDSTTIAIEIIGDIKIEADATFSLELKMDLL